MQEITSFKNKMLIAMPSLRHPIFNKGVIFVCQHNYEGALGLVINHPMDMRLKGLLDQMNIMVDDPKIANMPVYVGGPMQQDRGFILHSSETTKWETTVDISDEVSLTTSQDILKAIACGEGPKHFLITLGYAGWNKAQLDREIKENSWLSTDYDKSVIFNVPISKRWNVAAQKMGVDMRLLSSQVGHA
jgi:putative transcriptional regulator